MPPVNTRVERLCAWTGVVFMAVLGLAMIPLSGLIPPTAPTASADEIRQFYLDHLTGVRIGMFLAEAGMVGWLLYAAAIIQQMRRIERPPHLVSRITMAANAAIFVLAEVGFIVWVLAAFRPGETDPDITRMLHDAGWMFFLFALPPFGLMLFAIGYVTLIDRRSEPIFPRWYGYLCLWAAVGVWPSMLMVFFKTGPFAYRGLIAMYLPMIVLGAWMTISTWLVLRAIDRQAAPPLASSR